jgi:hypothetical protein
MSINYNDIPLRTTSLKCSSDHTTPILYTAPDRHSRRYGFKGRQCSVNHIIHATHARPFGLLCSVAMSVQAWLTKITLVFFLGTYMACTHTVCERRYV